MAGWDAENIQEHGGGSGTGYTGYVQMFDNEITFISQSREDSLTQTTLSVKENKYVSI